MARAVRCRPRFSGCDRWSASFDLTSRICHRASIEARPSRSGARRWSTRAAAREPPRDAAGTAAPDELFLFSSRGSNMSRHSAPITQAARRALRHETRDRGVAIVRKALQEPDERRRERVQHRPKHPTGDQRVLPAPIGSRDSSSFSGSSACLSHAANSVSNLWSPGTPWIVSIDTASRGASS
jgi:hypothetical protein